MAGRRLRNAVKSVISSKLGLNAGEPHVVIAGLSNVYTHYITTIEEYGKQRYEGASTLYGPHTLDAYIQQYGKLTMDMLEVGRVAFDWNTTFASQ